MSTNEIHAAIGSDRFSRSWFEQWRSLSEFEMAVEKAAPCDSDLRDQQFKFWREAWVASTFVRKAVVGDILIRLTPDSSPQGDFELRDNNGTRGYEIAEILDSAMPPALKKLRAEGGKVLHESEDSVSGALARAEIPRLIAQKAQKNYPAGTGLIFYMNVWDNFEREGLQGLVPVTEYKFASIWILTGRGALQIFPV